MNVVITGVSKGIGLALSRLALDKGHNVFGIARRPDDSEELMKLKKQNRNLEILKLDLVDNLASQKLISFIGHVSVDLLINNAGIYQDGTSKDDFLKSFEVNTFVPFMVTETLLPQLRKSSNPKVIHITSLMGSIHDNSSGGAYAYRASKAALNMVHKSLTIDQPWLTSLVLHPGWVQTDMGGANAPTSVDESANGIWKVMESISLKDSGQFRNYQGRPLPW